MQHIELRPERRLLKSNFDGYKLSLNPIPILRLGLAEHNRPHRIRPNEQQYSYYHARLFGMQNHLVRDPWSSGHCYYVDASGMVQRVHYDQMLGRLKPISAVFKLPLTVEPPLPDLDRTPGTYNCSMLFASERHCLLSDGRGVIRVLETGQRTNGRDWKARCVFRPAETDSRSGFSAGGCMLLDARFLVQDGKTQLHCVAMQVEHHLERPLETMLYWFTLEQNIQQDEEWTLLSSRMLRGRGYPRYCSLDYCASGVLLASDKPFHFVYDSERPVDTAGLQPTTMKSTAVEIEAYETFPYEWYQTINELVIKFIRQANVHYQVETNPSMDGLRIFANNTIVIDGSKLFSIIDHDSTFWSMDRAVLEITLKKQATGIMWPFLFPGGPDETVKAASGNDTTARADLPPATSLDAPLEDCDFEDVSEAEEYFTLERLSSVSHQVTHHVPLGGGPPLFSTMLRAGLPAAIVLRHDVDACLWQLQPPSGPDDCQLQHEGTLHAFGYVQASKRQQKFLSCSTDFGYAVICESKRRLFIYKGSYGVSSVGLRKRNGPAISLGQQRIVSLDDDEEILGICCEKEITLLLTESGLVALQLNTEE